MEQKRFRLIKQIFRDALSRDQRERSAFLDKACEGNRSLRAEVEKLLDSACEEDSFLDPPSIKLLPAADPGAELVGAQIGRYTVTRLISSGGMGTVYEALQDHPQRAVAVKVMKQSILTPSILRRFEYEAQILASLKHPGIAQVFESGTFPVNGGQADGEGPGVPYFVMEFIPDARAITDSARASDLDLQERLDLFLQVCNAMHHGHQKGIIHRDLKPSNILVDGQGFVKIIDFGVARATDSDIASTTVQTQVGQLIGTLQYMSPEQCEADPHNLDIRSDIYALGVVLFELICGELPYDVQRASIIEATRLIREEPPKKPSTVKRTLRGDMETIVLKALEKERERRYQTVADLKDDIRRFLAGEVIHARPVGPATKIWKRVRRNPLLSTALAAAIIAVLTVVVAIPWTIAAAESEKSRVETEARIAVEKKRIAAVAAEKEAKEQRAIAQQQAELANERYSKIIRLSDVKRLADLEQRAALLWPACPSNVDGLEAWITEAEDLLERLDLHVETMDALRQIALPYGEDEARCDRETHPRWTELEELRAGRKHKAPVVELISNTIAEVGPDFDPEILASLKWELKKFEGEVADLDRDIKELETLIARRRTWKFENMEFQWQHDALQGLVRGMNQLAAPDTGTLESIRKRLDFASTIKKKSILEFQDAWDHTRDSIADRSDCPAYNGLEIAEQIGLVPLGRDLQSGLWEFAHLQTGKIPVRGPDEKLVLTEGMGLVFVLLPGGTYRRGAAKPRGQNTAGMPNVDPIAQPYEGPVKEVTIGPFLLSKYEMTQGQWERFRGHNPSYYFPKYVLGGKQHSLLHPVENVNWFDCAETLALLNLRFPTEAEWEYACRAGTTTYWYTGNDQRSLIGAANIIDDFCRTHAGLPDLAYETWIDDGWAAHAPVGSFRPNAFGLHDMHGNVSEWCRDTMSSYFSAPVDGTAFVQLSLNRQIYRGGSYRDIAAYTRSSNRERTNIDDRTITTGVRPAFSLTE